jgi:hypothetical protein
MFNQFEHLLSDGERTMDAEHINTRLEQLNEKGMWRGLTRDDSGEQLRLQARYEQLTGVNWYDV